MNNFELIDDYLANRLQESDRKSFEQQLEGDPDLKEALEFQQQVVDGVRQARAMELKTMLNNVPVGGSTWGGAQVAAGIISAGIVATSLYFYFNNEQEIANSTEEIKKEIIQPGEENKSLEPVVVPSGDEKDAAVANEKSSKEITRGKKEKTSKPVTKPAIDVVDPSSELTEDNIEKVNSGSTAISASRMEVITDSQDKKYTFHYQFAQGKLLLYGPFDKSLYEILEIHGEGHAVFLFYRENYYLLDEQQSNITHLSAIRDPELLKKLKEYRGR